MTSMELLELLGGVRSAYVLQAHEETAATAKHTSLKRPFLIAAIVALMLLLMGCTVAYVNGWFTDFFAARSEDPLSSEQIEFIQEHEQLIMETQTKGDWTVELKSAICDGETGYVMFSITAPEDIDLEGYHAGNYGDHYIIPGNNSWGRDKARALIIDSTGWAHKEENYCWQEASYWQADNDGKSNTLNFVLETRCEKMYSDREMLIENPFIGTEFIVTFDDFTLEYEDPEVRKKIDEKYAGQDYIIDGEELEGLHKSEILVEETWEFTITFDEEKAETDSVELITGEPVMTWGLVSWKLTDDPIFYETGSGIAAVKIVSFKLNSFGATIQYELEEPAYSAFIEYQSTFGYTDRYIYAVMKDGSQIALHTDSTGDKLKAETPIVLSEVDHILLGDMAYIQRGDGVIIPMPG